VRQARAEIHLEQSADGVDDMIAYAVGLQTIGARTEAEILRKPRAERPLLPANGPAVPRTTKRPIRPWPG
jgi:hypothetical protein